MKKLVSCALVLTMLLSLAACGKKGGGFASKQKKIISAAESVCGAEEATKKQKKKLKTDDTDPTDPEYSDGVYVTFSADDIEDIDFGQKAKFDKDEINQLFFFTKSDADSQMAYFVTYLFEMNSQDDADDLFEYSLETWGASEKQVKKEAKNYNADYGYEDDDDTLSIIMVSEDKNLARCVYVRRDAKVVTICVANVLMDSDLYEEVLEFYREAGFTDLEALLDD